MGDAIGILFANQWRHGYNIFGIVVLLIVEIGVRMDTRGYCLRTQTMMMCGYRM